MSEWQKIKKVRPHHTAKNKNLEAIFVTSENAEALSEETQAFSVLGKALHVGVMHLQRMDVWMVCINPKGRPPRKYIFVNEAEFERYFELEE